MSTPPPADQFWLLTGEVPAGPFTAAQVHAELAAGRATWQTPACPVGGTTWLPVLKTPRLGPAADPAAPAPAPARPQGSAPNPDGRFWLRAGGDTAGPHRVREIRARLRAGRSPRDAEACRVGTEEWVPVEDVTGPLDVEPAAPLPPPRPPTRPAGGVAATAPAPAPAAPPPAGGSRDTVAGLIGLAVLGVVGWLVYEWVRPPTAAEVCRKVEAATTPAEARRYCTPRVYPLLDAAFADKAAPDPNDVFELTQEADGPEPNTKLVGFRGSWFVPEAGRRVPVEGHYRVVRADGWKVDDIVFTGVGGASLPGPVSLAAEYRRFAPAAARPAADDRPARSPWGGWVFAGWAVLKAGGAKSVGLGVLGVLGAVAALRRRRPGRGVH